MDSVAVSNLFLAFLPSLEGFPPPSSSERSVFYYILVLDILIKIYFSLLARILVFKHKQNYWISAVILILFGMPKPQIKRRETKKSSRGRDTRLGPWHWQVFPGVWWGYLCAIYSHKDGGASITGWGGWRSGLSDREKWDGLRIISGTQGSYSFWMWKQFIIFSN